MIILDGSVGEGGGQIIRSALSLSIITGRAFCIDHIRAKRSKPGLLRQHLTAVNAAAAISNARVEGNELGSARVIFEPSGVKPGRYHWSIGTAGSTSLVLQTVLVPLLSAAGPSELRITGGTHARFAPAFDFISRAYLPLLSDMGAKVSIELVRHGFYPRGGGEVAVFIEPSDTLKAISVCSRGERISQSADAVVAGVPGKVATRELNVIKKRLAFTDNECRIHQLTDDQGPGNVLTVTLQHKHVTEVFTQYGDRGVSAETVAKRLAGQVREYIDSDAAIGPFLADQLLLPMAVAGQGRFVTTTPSQHFLTNKDVIETFTGVTTRVSDTAGHNLVEIGKSLNFT